MYVFERSPSCGVEDGSERAREATGQKPKVGMRAVVGAWVRDRCRMCVGGGDDGVDVGIKVRGGVQNDSNFVA